MFICAVCGNQYTRKLKIERHIKTHEMQRNDNDVVELEAEPSHSCNMCPSQFDHKWQLNRHSREVHEGALIRCNHCSKQFRNQNVF